MMEENFPALSVRQPWAELIVSGRKSIEIRSWETKYRGRLWIHAGQHHDEELDARFSLHNLFRGGFIGLVELTSIEPFDELRWEAWGNRHLDAGSYKPNLFAWVLCRPRRLCSPVRASGHLGVFQLDLELLTRLNEVGLYDEFC